LAIFVNLVFASSAESPTRFAISATDSVEPLNCAANDASSGENIFFSTTLSRRLKAFWGSRLEAYPKPSQARHKPRSSTTPAFFPKNLCKRVYLTMLKAAQLKARYSNRSFSWKSQAHKLNPTTS
jgi:hypothetical protein